MIALLTGRLSMIEQQIVELQSLRHTLADVLEAAESKVSRGEEVRLCGILDGDRLND